MLVLIAPANFDPTSPTMSKKWTKDELCSADPLVAEVVWALLCRQPQTLYTLPSEDWVQVMNQGSQWGAQAAGYNATSAMMVIRGCTGRIVSSVDMAYFRTIFLYAFALCFEMSWDASFPVLTPEQTETAFLLQEFINEHPENQGDTELHWDKSKLHLGSRLTLALKRAEVPMTHELRKELLKELPVVEGIPEFAAENNFKSNVAKHSDKVHGAW